MTIGYERARIFVTELIREYGVDALIEKLRPKTTELPAHVPRRDEVSA